MKAYSLDFYLKEILSNHTGRGIVHSVFNSAVNLQIIYPSLKKRRGTPTHAFAWVPRGWVGRFNGRLITFYTSPFNQPGAVVVDKIPSGIKQGDEVEVKWPLILFGRHSIDLSDAKIWKEKFRCSNDGYGLADFRERKKGAARNIFGNEYKSLIDTFSGKELKDIIGLGDGLTPAGDDYILGVLNSLYYEKKVFPGSAAELEWEKLLLKVRKYKNRTNDISVSFFEYALEGRISERAMNLLNAVFCASPPDEIMSVADTFYKWGATSGKFHLLGLTIYDWVCY